MHQYRKNLTVLALLLALTTAAAAVEVNMTSELENGSFQGTHLQDGEIRLGHGANDDSLVAYYNFESKVPNKVVDASGNGNNGTLYGEELYGALNNFDFDSDSGWTTGKRGPNALEFDGGDDYVSISSSSEFDTKSASVSVWIKPDSNNDGDSRIFYHTSSDSGLTLSSGEAVGVEYRGCSGWFGDGPNLVTGEWNKVTAVWDDSKGEVRVYKSGTQTHSYSMDGGCFSSSSGGIRIATPHWTSNGKYYDGGLDNIRFYNRALTSKEVSNLYKGTEDPRKGLVGEWTFDEGEGTVAHDTSNWKQGIRQGKALEFDGNDDYVDTNYGGDFRTNAFSVSLWVHEDFVSTNHVFMSTHTGSGDGWILSSRSDGDYRFWLAGDGLRGGSTVENSWQHVVGVRDGSGNQYIYVNGKRVATGTSTADVSNSQTAWIGERPDSFAHLDGQIQNVRVYDRGLTIQEISELYNPSPGTFTSDFIEAEEGSSWKDFNWNENLAQNTDVKGRVQTASEVERTDDYSEWREGTSSFSGPTEGLVGYWRFENNVSGSGGTVRDWSGNNNDGTTKNGVNTSVEGFMPQSNAYNFDGKDDYVSLPDEKSQYPKNDISVGAWVYVKKGNDIVDINYAASSDSDRESGVFLGTSGAAFTLKSNSDAGLDIASIEENTWKHILITRDRSAGTARYYINGDVVAENTSFDTSQIEYEPPDQSYDDDSVNIGYWTRAGWPGSYFEGKIDEVRIYNQALSSSEVDSLYTSGSYTSDWIRADNINWVQWKQTKKGSDLEPLSQWRLDGGSQYVNDSLNRVQGTLGSGINEESDDPKRINNCRFDECLSFDGDDDHVRFDSETYSDYAVTYWYYHTSSNSEQITGDSDRGWHWIEHDPSNNEISSQGAAGNVYSYNVPLETNSWHFVTYDYGDGELYHDGELVDTNPSQSISIQDIGTGGDSFWTGKIDDFRIYKSIDAEEAQALYTSPSQSWDSSSLQVRSRESDPESDSLVASYNFEGVGQTVVDSSGEGNSGTLGSTAGEESSDPQRASGYSGQAVKFDGNSWVETQYTDEPESITISAWVKPGSVDTIDGVVGRIDDNGDQEDCYLGTRDGYWEFTCQMNPGGSDDWRETNSEALPNVGKWQHLVGRYDSAEEKLAIYINGDLKDEVNAPAPLHPTDNSKFQVGRWEYNDASQGLFEGKIDEVRIYDTALSSTEISELYSMSDFSSTTRGFTGSSIDVNNSGEYYQFKLGSLTGTSKSVPEVESVTLADTSGWTDWSSSPGSSLDVGSSSFVQAQFNLSSTEPEESPELSAFSILEGLGICDERGPVNECIVDAAHSLTAEIIDIASIFEAEDSAELTASTGTATLNITNSSVLSGSWIGSFNISTSKDEATRIKPGAEFKPENGRIVIGE
jgi:hypothetical protein